MDVIILLVIAIFMTVLYVDFSRHVKEVQKIHDYYLKEIEKTLKGESE